MRARAAKRDIKKPLWVEKKKREKKIKGGFWQTCGGEQRPPYVCGDEDNKSGGNYQSSSGEPVRTLRRARSDWRCYGDKPRSLQRRVYADVKNTVKYFYVAGTQVGRLLQRGGSAPLCGRISGVGITTGRWRRKVMIKINVYVHTRDGFASNELVCCGHIVSGGHRLSLRFRRRCPLAAGPWPRLHFYLFPFPFLVIHNLLRCAFKSNFTAGFYKLSDRWRAAHTNTYHT